MPRPRTTDAQISLRLKADAVAKADEIAEALQASRPGFTTTRSDVLRAAIIRGLDAMHAETVPAAVKKPKK